MSKSENDRPARTPRWIWLTFGGASAAAIFVAVIIAVRPPAAQTAQATPTPNIVDNRDSLNDSIEADEDRSLVTYPRQSGNSLARDGDVAAEQSPISTAAPTTPETTPDEAVPLNFSTEAAAKLPPKPDSATAVGLLASTRSVAATGATGSADDKQNKTPSNPPGASTDRPIEPPHGPDPTYEPAKSAAEVATRAHFEKLIHEMLEQGWSTKATDLRQAEEKFKAASELCPDDPRASYAYALVLLKHNQYDAAIKQFDLVGEQGKPPYLPAFRAAIWLRVLRKSYEPAALDLVRLTRTWRALEPGTLPEWVQSDYVTWSGQMAGFLDGPVDSRSVDEIGRASCRERVYVLV